MPNRIIKETIRTSKVVNNMTDFQFRLWVYLITYVDDYGRGSADAEILKGFVFPRRKRVTESDIDKALAELAGIGCIHLYKIDGESYFYFPNWGEHQRIQTKKSKFPAPPTEIHSDSRLVTVNNGDLPPEYNPNPNTNPNVVNAPTREETFQEVVLAIQQIKPVTKSTEYDRIADMVDHYPRDWLIEAIKIAVTKKARTFEYVDGILANWRKAEFKDEDKPWIKNKREASSQKTAIDILNDMEGE